MSTRWRSFLNALAAENQPRAIFAALEAVTKEIVGTLLFTAMTHDLAEMKSIRLYSENEEAYPSGGWKPLRPGLWMETVIEKKQCFSALTIEEIAVVFPDYEVIRSLGCESSMNLPVVMAGKVIGTVNLLHRKGYYTAERVAAAAEVTPFAAIAFLAAAQSQRKG